MRRVGWYATAMEAIETICRRQRFLCSDDVWEELDKHSGPCPGFAIYTDGEIEHAHGCCAKWEAKYQAPHQNAMGAVINAAVQQRLIKPTGRILHSNRPAAKHRNIQVHESQLFTIANPDAELAAFIRNHEHKADVQQPSLLGNGGTA